MRLKLWFALPIAGIVLMCWAVSMLPGLSGTPNTSESVLLGSSKFNVTISDDELFVRVAAVYEGGIDHRYWVTEDSLRSAAPTFVGQPVLMGHEQKDPRSCIGVVIASEVRYDWQLETHYIEMILSIRDEYAMGRVKAGLFNKLSIGFEATSVACNICGGSMLTCSHENGIGYRTRFGQIFARGIINDFEGLEISFVNVPASRPARVLEWSNDVLELSKRN